MADETPDEETGADEAAAPPAPAEAAEPTPEPDPLYLELGKRLEEAFGGDTVIETAECFGNPVVRVAHSAWHRTAEIAHSELECDYLSFVSGIDWEPAPREGDEAGGDTSSPVQPTEMTFGAAGSAGRFQVFAHVESTARKWGVTFKADLDEAEPRVASWVDVYPGADWHERECWEMFGFAFDGHPSLRHLYLPSEFEGHPLRKDYPLLARVVKPWPGLVDVEAMPGEPAASEPAAGESANAEGDEGA